MKELIVNALMNLKAAACVSVTMDRVLFINGQYTVEEFAEVLARLITPLPMVLHCPVCRTQHIDKPDGTNPTCSTTFVEGEGISPERPVWTNPPHRSHLCEACGCIWRPSDIATTGVAAITTKGAADNFGTVFDLDVMHWESIKKAAKDSSWIPAEYCMNDWVYDACRFLESGGHDPR